MVTFKIFKMISSTSTDDESLIFSNTDKITLAKILLRGVADSMVVGNMCSCASDSLVNTDENASLDNVGALKIAEKFARVIC